MGFWGTDLYQNDTSADVKDTVEEQLRKGRSIGEITEELIKDFEGVEDDLQEKCAFWLALADTQWKWGVLLPDVKKRALQLLEEGGDLICWRDSKTVIQLQRKKVLIDLQYELMSPQPPVKRPVKRRSYKCPWKNGDVFAYPLESDLAKEKGLYGEYFLLQKVDERIWYPEHIIPIVYIKLTENGELPQNLEEYDRLRYVQTSISRYETRFWPIDGRRPEEDIAEKSKIKYEVDENGNLPHFRISIVTESKKQVPSSLLYVGNFLNAVPPEKEFIPHTKLNVDTVYWKNFDDTFESLMIKRYGIFNHQ